MRKTKKKDRTGPERKGRAVANELPLGHQRASRKWPGLVCTTDLKGGVEMS